MEGHYINEQRSYGRSPTKRERMNEGCPISSSRPKNPLPSPTGEMTEVGGGRRKGLRGAGSDPLNFVFNIACPTGELKDTKTVY
jgi:hypothetical protein